MKIAFLSFSIQSTLMKSFSDNYYGNIFFPYISNTKGNKRGDVLNFVTMVHAFDKDCVNVSRNEEGKLSFKLRLAKANNFDSSNSHEAIADVEVTMQLMCCLKIKEVIYLKYFLIILRRKMLKKKFFKMICLHYIIIYLTIIKYILSKIN